MKCQRDDAELKSWGYVLLTVGISSKPSWIVEAFVCPKCGEVTFWKIQEAKPTRQVTMEEVLRP